MRDTGFQSGVPQPSEACLHAMNIDTLVVAMHQHDRLLVQKMNVQTDTIVGNQSDTVSDETFTYQGHTITYLNRSDRGVGRNRNRVLESSSAEICVLADDDLRFVDGYPDLVQEAFEACPQADILVFNLVEKVPTRKANDRYRRVRWFGYGSYGAPRLALRRRSVLQAGVRFSLCFGGGARYGSGEDTIFLHDCLRHGLRIYTAPYALAEIDQNAPSTHYTGINEQYFFSKGAAYTCMHPVLWPVFSLSYVMRHRKQHKGWITVRAALGAMNAGSADYRHYIRRSR